MQSDVEILEEETAYSGFLGLKRFQLRHSLFQGGMSDPLTRERIESYTAASVLLYDPNLDKVILVEQFRIGALNHPAGAWVLEVVGGIVEDEEKPEQVALREAVEEAGCEILDLLSICDFMVSPGYSNERIHLFCGRVDASGAGGIHGVDDEGEDIRVQVLDAGEAIGELYGGRINSTSSIIAMQWLSANRLQLKERWSQGL